MRPECWPKFWLLCLNEPTETLASLVSASTVSNGPTVALLP